MAYIGVSPSNGVRRVHTYTATASQTTFSGAGAEGTSLSYKDSNYVDVYQNGVKLGDADYTSTSGTSIVLAQAASVNDLVGVVGFDVFSVADTVSKADGGTFDNAVTITTDDNNAQLTLVSTDADASSGPQLDLYRNSASPADSDVFGRVRFLGENDADEQIAYATIFSKAVDVSDGTESANLRIDSIVGGTNSQRLEFNATEAVFNEGGANIDFRVESDTNTNMLFVDAGNNRVHIGSSTGAATGNGLEITNTDGDAGLVLYRNFSGSNVSSETSSNKISFVLEDSAQKETIAQIAPMANAGNSDRLTGIIRLMTSDGDGNLDEQMRTRDPAYGGTMIGKTSTSASVAGFQIRTGISGGNNICQNDAVVIKVNRQSDDGELIAFLQANNQEGSISVSGGTVSYNAFSASHWSRLSDNSKPTILVGTVIETIDEMCDWYQAEFTIKATVETPEVVEKVSIALPKGKSVGDKISITHEGITYDDATILKEKDNKHPKCKISDTADSKRVYGVYTAWDNDDDAVNDMYVTAVGTHVVRINKDVAVQAGDLLSSNGDGTAKVQDDDIIRSKTIGKVLTNIKQETYSDGSYTVPCALYCG